MEIEYHNDFKVLKKFFNEEIIVADVHLIIPIFSIALFHNLKKGYISFFGLGIDWGLNEFLEEDK